MRRSPLLLVPALALALAACSSADTPEPDVPETAAGEVVLVGTESVAWVEDTKSATLVDGVLEATLVCDGVVPHNLLIEGVQDDAVLADCAGDDEAAVTIELEPGTYTYYCSIPGHREAGMEGTLTVE